LLKKQFRKSGHHRNAVMYPHTIYGCVYAWRFTENEKKVKNISYSIPVRIR